MNLAFITVEKIAEMFLIMMAGVAACRFGIVDTAGNKRLSALLLNIVSPAMIISSYQMEFKEELLEGLGLTMLFSALSFVLVIAMTRIVLHDKEKTDLEVEKMAVIYSNCGFIGIPLINGLLGQKGVFFITAYITVFNIFVWSHGLGLMRGSGNWRETARHFVQPATVAIAIGLVLFLGHIPVPAVISEPIASVGDMNTPLAMIVAGCSLAESRLLDSLKRLRTYWISFLKLIAVPAVTLALFLLLGITSDVALVVLIGAACPTGAMGTMFAIQYHKNSSYASELFTVTTLLSMVTIPIVVSAFSLFAL